MKRRLRWFRREKFEHELDDELAFHIDTRARALVDEGVAPDEARRRPLAEFGCTAPIKEGAGAVPAGDVQEPPEIPAQTAPWLQNLQTVTLGTSAVSATAAMPQIVRFLDSSVSEEEGGSVW